MKKEIISIIERSIETKKEVRQYLCDEIERAVEILLQCYRKNGKVLVCGNGGSAADAQHMAGELVGRFKLERKALPCISLSTDTSILTAWSNDYSFDSVFSRQLEALGQKGDALIGISTSGNSMNVLNAVKKANEMKMETIAFLGCEGGKIKDFANLSLIVNSKDTPRVQEAHAMIIHIICELVERKLFGK